MRVLLLSPLPPPSGGIARWTERYLEWCNGKHDVAVVNTALQGERAGEAGKQRKLTDEIKRALYVIRETNKGLKRKTDIVHINIMLFEIWYLARLDMHGIGSQEKGARNCALSL